MTGFMVENKITAHGCVFIANPKLQSWKSLKIRKRHKKEEERKNCNKGKKNSCNMVQLKENKTEKYPTR